MYVLQHLRVRQVCDRRGRFSHGSGCTAALAVAALLAAVAPPASGTGGRTHVGSCTGSQAKPNHQPIISEWLSGLYGILEIYGLYFWLYWKLGVRSKLFIVF